MVSSSTVAGSFPDLHKKALNRLYDLCVFGKKHFVNPFAPQISHLYIPISGLA
jgi:hypothetical protein